MVVHDNIALIDMDGTVADFDRRMQEELEKLRSPDERMRLPSIEEKGPDWLEARMGLIKRQPGFWRGLPRIDLGFEVVEELVALDFELHVLTKGPRRTKSAWTEKVEWCAEHLPDAHPMIVSKKSLVYGRVLVDDWPPFFEDWLVARPRGLVVCVAQTWNVQYARTMGDVPPLAYRVCRYDGTNRDALHAALRWARDRRSGTEANEERPTVPEVAR